MQVILLLLIMHYLIVKLIRQFLLKLDVDYLVWIIPLFLVFNLDYIYRLHFFPDSHFLMFLGYFLLIPDYKSKYLGRVTTWLDYFPRFPFHPKHLDYMSKYLGRVTMWRDLFQEHQDFQVFFHQFNRFRIILRLRHFTQVPFLYFFEIILNRRSI